MTNRWLELFMLLLCGLVGLSVWALWGHMPKLAYVEVVPLLVGTAILAILAAVWLVWYDTPFLYFDDNLATAMIWTPCFLGIVFGLLMSMVAMNTRGLLWGQNTPYGFTSYPLYFPVMVLSMAPQVFALIALRVGRLKVEKMLDYLSKNYTGPNRIRPYEWSGIAIERAFRMLRHFRRQKIGERLALASVAYTFSKTKMVVNTFETPALVQSGEEPDSGRRDTNYRYHPDFSHLQEQD